MYKILTGKQRGLVFPVMCNGHIKIDYSENVPDSTYDLGYGVFSHVGSFTIEAIITPFDINGDGQKTKTAHYGGKDRHSEKIIQTADYDDGTAIIDMDSTADLKVGMLVVSDHFSPFTFITVINSATRITISRVCSTGGADQTNVTVTFRTPDSIKVMPSPPTVDRANVGNAITQTNYQSSLYLTNAARITHGMQIFASTGISLKLENFTNTNVNQPAEYRLNCAVNLGGTINTFHSDVLIKPALGKQFFYKGTDDKLGFEADGLMKYKKVTTFTGFNGSNSISVVNSLDSISVGEEVYIKSGSSFVSLGRVTVLVNSSTLTTTGAASSASISSTTTDLYLPLERNAAYINQQFHIACAFNAATSAFKMFLNGKEVKLYNESNELDNSHSGTADFNFGNGDIYIGSSGSAVGAGSATTNNQFMGILHELSIIRTIKQTFNIRNLLPNYDDTLLYLRFEEIDL